MLWLEGLGGPFGDHHRDPLAVWGEVPVGVAEVGAECGDPRAGFFSDECCALHGVADGHQLVAGAVHQLVAGPRPTRVVAAIVGDLPLAALAGGRRRERPDIHLNPSRFVRLIRQPAAVGRERRRHVREVAVEKQLRRPGFPLTALVFQRHRPHLSVGRTPHKFVVRQPFAVWRERRWNLIDVAALHQSLWRTATICARLVEALKALLEHDVLAGRAPHWKPIDSAERQTGHGVPLWIVEPDVRIPSFGDGQRDPRAVRGKFRGRSRARISRGVPSRARASPGTSRTRRWRRCAGD